jgi:hypothetical protein
MKRKHMKGRKGYVISPMLFIALFMIIATLAIYLMNADKKAADAITRENALVKADLKAAQMRTIFLGSIRPNAYRAAGDARDENELQADMLFRLNTTGMAETLKIVQEGIEFRVEGNATAKAESGSANASDPFSFSIHIDYPFYDAMQIADSFNQSDADCTSLDAEALERIDQLGRPDWFVTEQSSMQGENALIGLEMKNMAYNSTIAQPYKRNYTLGCK